MPESNIQSRRAAAWARRLEIEAGRRPGGFRQRLRSAIDPDRSRVTRGLIEGAFFLLGLKGPGRRTALDLDVRDHEMPIDRLPDAFADYGLLHLSDLHLDCLPELPSALAEAVAPLRYDACVLTGDFPYRKHGALEPALAGLRIVREALHGDVFAVLGNHDPAALRDRLEALDIRVLVNESLPLERGGDRIYLLGVDDPRWYRTDDLEAALDRVPDDACRILLAHSPEIYEEAEARGIQLLLCGHTHGGQVALPGGTPLIVNARCPRRLAVRDWTWGNLRGYTSVGIGSTTTPVRIHVRPEVVVHRLTRIRA